MRDRPNGADLLDVARVFLLEEVAPMLKGQPRYIVLMMANAMGIAARELNEADRSRRAWIAVLDRVPGNGAASVEASIARLVASIRLGAHDADAALYDALAETVEIAASIWRPAKSAPAG
jgi:Domain of unknown function (DUF6285)